MMASLGRSFRNSEAHWVTLYAKKRELPYAS